MRCVLHLQNPADYPHPTRTQLRKWISLALQNRYEKSADITIRIVDETESAELNQRYRHRAGPTNVLSFPVELPAECEVNDLGDLVICAPLLEAEAKMQHKLLEAHWAHLVIHGTLHLLGFDHITPSDASEMETLEIQILHTLGYDNPYGDID